MESWTARISRCCRWMDFYGPVWQSAAFGIEYYVKLLRVNALKKRNPGGRQPSMNDIAYVIHQASKFDCYAERWVCVCQALSGSDRRDVPSSLPHGQASRSIFWNNTLRTHWPEKFISPGFIQESSDIRHDNARVIDDSKARRQQKRLLLVGQKAGWQVFLCFLNCCII